MWSKWKSDKCLQQASISDGSGIQNRIGALLLENASLLFSIHTPYTILGRPWLLLVCVMEARGRRWNSGEQRKAAPHLLEQLLHTTLRWHPGYVLKNVCSFWILFSSSSSCTMGKMVPIMWQIYIKFSLLSHPQPDAGHFWNLFFAPNAMRFNFHLPAPYVQHSRKSCHFQNWK